MKGYRSFRTPSVLQPIYSPDAYPDWHAGWANHRADMLALWSDVKPRLKRDLDKVEPIELVARDGADLAVR